MFRDNGSEPAADDVSEYHRWTDAKARRARAERTRLEAASYYLSWRWRMYLAMKNSPVEKRT